LNRDIESAVDEQSGLRMLKPINQVARVMQQHRGLSAGVLSGNEAMKDQRAAKEKEVSDAVAAADAALSAKLRETPAWKSIRQDWTTIQTQGLTWSQPDNVKRHTAMLTKVLQFMVDVADDTELTLDPVMDTYYFMDTIVTKMPAMLEQMGITRARGTALLTRKEISQAQRIEISSTIAQMDGTLKAQNINLEKVIRFAPYLQGALSAPTKAFSDSAEKIFALVRDDILGEKFVTNPQDYFAITTQEIDLGYKVMFDTLIPQFEQQLQGRVDKARKVLMLEIGLAILIAVLVAYLGLGTYYSVMNSVDDFSSGARRLADGDLTAEFDTWCG
jgi:methyl-accepting chemotaxis protein